MSLCVYLRSIFLQEIHTFTCKHNKDGINYVLLRLKINPNTLYKRFAHKLYVHRTDGIFGKSKIILIFRYKSR